MAATQWKKGSTHSLTSGVKRNASVGSGTAPVGLLLTLGRRGAEHHRRTATRKRGSLRRWCLPPLAMGSNILISGGGVAGLTLAYWLVSAGFTPVIVEASPQLRTGGHMTDFWGIGYTVAERMGSSVPTRSSRRLSGIPWLPSPRTPTPIRRAGTPFRPVDAAWQNCSAKASADSRR